MLGSLPTLPRPMTAVPNAGFVPPVPGPASGSPPPPGTVTPNRQQPALAGGPAPTGQQAPRGPTVRGQSPEEPQRQPRPAPPPSAPVRSAQPLAMPTPAQLGVSAAQTISPEIDWNAVDRRLGNLGAVCFQMNQL